MNTEVRTRSRAKVPDRGRRGERGQGERAAVPGSPPAPGRTGPVRPSPAGRPAGRGRVAVPERPTRPAAPGAPQRLTRPAAPAGPERLTGAGPLTGQEATASRGPAADRVRPVARTPFILLLLGLLGGGLICLLVINTTLAAGSFQITHLQQANVTLAQRAQALEQRLASEESPASIHRQALRLGMRQQQRLYFIDVRTGRIYQQPATLPGVNPVPGYTP
jgi:hypothetical protein